MCFSPQRRAIFQHLNFKKCSHTVSFLTFSLPNVLFATAACNVSTSELQKVLPDRQFFKIFTSKCAFRHSGVQFLMSPLSTYLRTRRFNRPTFRLTRHTNHWKNTAFRDFSNIWRGCIFFLLTFVLLHLLSADLTTLLCLSTVHIVGSFYLNFLRWMSHQTASCYSSSSKKWCLGLEKGGDLPISNQAVYPSLFVNMVLAAQIDLIWGEVTTSINPKESQDIDRMYALDCVQFGEIWFAVKFPSPSSEHNDCKMVLERHSFPFRHSKICKVLLSLKRHPKKMQLSFKIDKVK